MNMADPAGPRYDEFLKSMGLEINHIPQPRAPPRFIRPPTPLSIERPHPIVPDVSLIMGLNSASSSMISNDECRSNTIHNGITASPVNMDLDSVNCVNYFATSQQSSNTTFDSQNRSRDRNDSGHGTSALSISSNKEDTVTPVKGYQNSRNTKATCTPEQLNKEDLEFVKSTITAVLDIVKQQEMSIAKLSSQMQQLVAFQEKFLFHILRKGSGVTKAVQTDTDLLSAQCDVSDVDASSSVTSISGRKSSEKLRKSFRVLEQGSLRDRRKNSVNPATAQQQHINNNPVTTNNNSFLEPDEPSLPEEIKHNTENLSNFLQNLQLSNVQLPSMVSDTSIRSFHVPEYNNETFQNDRVVSPPIGLSVSAYDSCSEDEFDTPEALVNPTTTYYNNLLGTVNRFLEGGHRLGTQNQNPYGNSRPGPTPKSSNIDPTSLKMATETTVYGMSSRHLSFATKQYLQKYGLVNQLTAPATSLPDQCSDLPHTMVPVRTLTTRPAPDRILDITAIKNQPKLL